ncbi:dual specificity protein kinase [Pelomyxa schiedti]|nr:dual specificity protein kinase [Pelomyxa schiedti]
MATTSSTTATSAEATPTPPTSTPSSHNGDISASTSSTMVMTAGGLEPSASTANVGGTASASSSATGTGRGAATLTRGKSLTMGSRGWSADEFKRHFDALKKEASLADHSMDDPKLIKPAEIDLQDKIGEGKFAQVFKATCRGKPVAAKVLSLSKTNEDYIEDFKKEVDIMSKISHPNCCLYMGVCVGIPGKMIIITELYNMSLDTVLFSSQPLSPSTRMKMGLDVAMGMNWLHCCDPKVVHSDLKASNILVGENLRCVVSDFGQAKLLSGIEGELNSVGGTPLYMAPEKILGEPHNESIDVYSFGLIIWELYTRQRVFEQYAKTGQLSTFITAVAVRGERPNIPADCPADLTRLMKHAWSRDVSERPPFSEIVDLMKEIVILCSITDQHARNFWHVNFGMQYVVPWEAIKPALKAHLKRPSMFWLKALIAEKAPDYSSTPDLKTGKPPKAKHVVRIEKFGNIVQYFGPFLPEDTPTTTITDNVNHIANSRNFLDKIQSTLQSPWFHGDCDSTEATKLLKASGHRTSFLVRFSAREPGCFTISRMTTARDKRDFVHYRVPNTPEGITLPTGTFPSLAAALSHKKTVESHQLKNPVSPTPYSALSMRWINKVTLTKRKEDISEETDLYS